MTLKHMAAIVGVGDIGLQGGRVPAGKSVLQIQAMAAKVALEDAGLSLKDVDGILTTGMWGIPGPGTFPSMLMAEYLGIQPKFSDSTNIGGASFEAHVGHAAAAISAGLCEVALILYGSTQLTERTRTLGAKFSGLTDQFVTPFGMPLPIGAYALAARRHMYQYGTTSEQLAEVAVSTRKWALLNPQATKREPLSVSDVLSSPLIADPLHLYDCCLVTDGAGAVVVTTSTRARTCRRAPIWVLGHGESHSHSSIQAAPDITQTAAKLSGRNAFQMAGVMHEDVDLVEIYDSFTITALLTLEMLGFCGLGEGGPFVTGGRTAPGGELPMNTNGGGLSYAHPGMYGIFLIIEAVRQLRGECGTRQVPNAKIALVNGTGLQLSSASTCILGRD
ncbi:acetyl-CoA acetyltransferase [Alicyclobacillus sp. ALC3]|uniref:acetyl-CoA acetyltransferase n=1 Tax=Alicyclobacillus sp. ALC3 TaxID=2796143 RepID=UPI002378F857|nr:acetyl-CoA acetyltransferase [Alicyclobacillus sp. ALC3]WDL97686.1 thiolase [Alicyclobacillus sp. ALC3]